MIYTYIREPKNHVYNIDNPERVDGEGKQIHLSKEIEVAFPGKKFKIHSIASECKIDFEIELTAEEKIILDTTVNNHKNNV